MTAPLQFAHGSVQVTCHPRFAVFLADAPTGGMGPDRSAKDLVEALGVPHVEIDLLTANGTPVGLDYQVQPGDHIAAAPLERPVDLSRESHLGRPLLPAPRFVADVHLGKLVRYLRMLGLDCRYDPPWDDDRLAQLAHDGPRVMLSRDIGLLKRGCVDHGLFLRSDQSLTQAAEVLARYHLAPWIAPLTRCPTCNGPLDPVDKAAVLDQLPASTAATYDTFHRCRDCAKVYWPGAHHHRLQSLIGSLLPTP